MGDTSSVQGCISLGPWGGPEEVGEPWSFLPKDGTTITQIVVGHGNAINSLIFQTIDEDGEVQYSPMFGSLGFNITDKVCISAAEYLKALDITFGPLYCNVGMHGKIENPQRADESGSIIIKSLMFRTNVATYGPFGKKDGTSVSIPMKNGTITGFHGYAGQYINAIGFFAKLKTSTSSPCESGLENVAAIFKSKGQALPCDPGPWGGAGGKQWDDGAFGCILQIAVFVREFYQDNGCRFRELTGLRFLYKKKDGQIDISREKGSCPSYDCEKRIVVDGSSEYFIGIEGFYGPILQKRNRTEVIRSITFYTNKGKYGPFGEEDGTYFKSPLAGGKIVGFFGRSGIFLNAIGVHMEYF